jgi:flagellin-specific chaperone FliS
MNTKRKKSISILIVTAITLVFAINLSAQVIDAETARNAVENTAQVIAEARIVIEESRSNIARLSLEKAIAIQNMATSFMQTERNHFAYKYTMEARREAWHAIALARADARIEDKLVNISENTKEKLSRLRERIIESDIRDERLNRLMMEARTQLEKSRMNAQQLRNQLAMNLAESSRKLTVQAEERLRRLIGTRDMAQRRLMLLERLAERARDRIGTDGADQDTEMLSRAEQELARAREMLNQGKYEAARMNIEKCERLLRGVARKIRNGNGGDPEQAMIEATRLMERAREMISGMNEVPEHTQGLFSEAEGLMLRIREMISEGNGDEAGRLMVRVRHILREAIDSIKSSDGPKMAENEIDNVIQMRNRIQELVGNCDSEGARKLFARAENRLNSAMGHFEAGRTDEAWAEARIARNLFQRIREICAG